MLKRTFDFIRIHNMVSQNDTVLVALSGGADSMALIYILSRIAKELGIKLMAIHINHGLRDDAGSDEQRAAEFCVKLGIPVEVGYCDVPLKMISEGLSLEVAARDARWDYIKEYALKCRVDKIAVAHHMGDRAETMLLNLTRGSGLSGLCAMKPMDGNIIRPLLFSQKSEILDFLHEEGISWREDESNKDNSIPRNYIRNVLLKGLGDINPQVINRMNNAAGLLSQDEDYINSVTVGYCSSIVKSDDGYNINRGILDNLHNSILSRILRLMALKNGAKVNIHAINIKEAIALISTGQVGSSIDWPFGLKVYIEPKTVWMGRVPAKDINEVALKNY